MAIFKLVVRIISIIVIGILFGTFYTKNAELQTQTVWFYGLEVPALLSFIMFFLIGAITAIIVQLMTELHKRKVLKEREEEYYDDEEEE